MGERIPLLQAGSFVESRLWGRTVKEAPRQKRAKAKVKAAAPAAKVTSSKGRKRQTAKARAASLRNLAKAREARGG